MKKFRKMLLSYTLLFAFIINVFAPLTVLAEEPNKGDIRNPEIVVGSTTNAGESKVTKTLTKINDTGLYEVSFDVVGKDNTKIEQEDAKPYILFVVDRSGTMDRCIDPSIPENAGTCTQDSNKRYYNAKLAVKTASESLHKAYPAAMIGAITFAGSSSKDHVIVEENFKAAALTTKNWTSISGYTPTHEGLNKAIEMLNSITDATSKHLILVSDGIPEDNNAKYDNYIDLAFSTANTIKSNGMEIYSIFIGKSDSKLNSSFTTKYKDKKTIEIMNEIASDPDSKYSFSATTVKQLTSAFESMVSSIVNVEVKGPAATSAKLTDTIASGWSYVEGSASSDKISVNGQEVTINIGNVTETTQTFKFKIQIDVDSETGWHRTNGDGTNNSFKLSGNNMKNTVETKNSSEVYWVQNTYDYSILYIYDGVVDSTKTVTGKLAKNKTVEVTDEMINANKGNYEFLNVDPSSKSLTITNDPTKNIIKVNYATYKKLTILKSLRNTTNNNSKFNIKITLKDKDGNLLNGSYNYKLNNGSTTSLVFTNGVANISIKGSDKVEFINIPLNTKYTVEETTTDGYKYQVKVNDGTAVNSSKTSGTLSSDVKVEIINTAGYELPETGSSGALIMLITGISLMGFAVIYKLRDLRKNY